MCMNSKCNDLTLIVAQALEKIKRQEGENFDLNKVNLAELGRMTGISRSKLRRIKSDGFKDLPHKLAGRTAKTTVLSGYTGVIDDLLRQNVTNSAVIYRRLKEDGYSGSLTTVKGYISKHEDLVPPKRRIVSPQGNRGRRYTTRPGESYQMDWGFVNVDAPDGGKYRLACFVMVCHCCGKLYVEFFPNARQENLFIGMIHAFKELGVPKSVLTDNMKSVVTGRDEAGMPVWQKDYELFMGNLCFETKLCKPRHPFTKGLVERMVQYVKGNFLAGRSFVELQDLNREAAAWCREQNAAYRKAKGCVPDVKHEACCMGTARALEDSPELNLYLRPERRISFDGFISYEGRRFGVPYWYPEKTCRVERDGGRLLVYDTSLSRVIAEHQVTRGRADSFCSDQYAVTQPEEHPTESVKASIKQEPAQEHDPGFGKYRFGEGLRYE